MVTISALLYTIFLLQVRRSVQREGRICTDRGKRFSSLFSCSQIFYYFS